MSFHLPPIAARAAVSGHPLMALRRAGREWVPKGAILIIFTVANTFFYLSSLHWLAHLVV